MENQPTESGGDSSRRSREIEVAWDEQQPPPTARVKLMCSYGGRIQPRHHDSRLSYVGGDTKILAVERAARFPAFLSRLASILPADDDICLKYQLPGEDLDALISLTNDEDLEHMMAEYDRLLRSPASKPAPRLRLFLFTSANSAAPPPLDQKLWFSDALSSVPPAPPISPTESPDFLFGFDDGFVPPPAVNVKVNDPAPEPTAVTEPSNQGARDDRQIGGSASEMQRQIHEIQRLQIADNQQQQQVVFQVGSMSRSNSNVSLSSPGLPGGDQYYIARAEEKAAPQPQIPAAYWPEQRGRFGSLDGEDQPIYLIPAGPGVYPRSMHPQAYYAVPRMMPQPPEGYREAAPPVYMVPMSPQPREAAYPEGGGAGRQQQQQQEAAGYSVAYDRAGRAVFYSSSVGPTFQTSSVGPTKPVTEGNKGVKPMPSQVS